MASKPEATVVRLEPVEPGEMPSPTLPPEMAGRADARELREFMLAFRGIHDPKSRRRILEAIENAAS